MQDFLKTEEDCALKYEVPLSAFAISDVSRLKF